MRSFDDRRAETSAQNVIFKGDEDGDAPGVGFDHFQIQRFDEARIDDSRGVPLAFETRPQFLGEGHHGSETEDGYIGAVRKDFGFADGQQGRSWLTRYAGNYAPWIADCARSRNLK